MYHKLVPSTYQTILHPGKAYIPLDRVSSGSAPQPEPLNDDPRRARIRVYGAVAQRKAEGMGTHRPLRAVQSGRAWS